MRAVVVESGKELATRLRVADSFFSRFKGLLGAPSLPQGEALWIIPCSSVHTFWMRFPIDVLFLDREQRVVALVSNLPPNRVTSLFRSAASVIELPAGSAALNSIAVGDQIAIT